MATVFDALNASDPNQNASIHAALAAGVDTLGQTETVTFYPYIRTVLPIDGYVFWLNANLLSTVQLAQHGLTSANPVIIEGASLHYASVGSQVEDETIIVRSVDLTSLQPVAALAAIAPDVMYVSTWQTDLGSFQFTFSRRSGYFFQAGVHHFVGDAIYPAFTAQLIDDISQFDQRPIVNNSLPFWFAMMQDTFAPAIPLAPLNIPSFQLYSAYLVPDNIMPAYGVVSIPPEATRTFTAMPVFDGTMGRSQLCADRVKITFYGLRADDIFDFLDYTLLYSQTTGNFGIMNMPVPRDERRPQVELTALAQKKYIEFEVSYLQSRARAIARQVIQKATLGNVITFPRIGPTTP